MAHGDPIPSPWVTEFRDYLSRIVRITVNFNNSNRALQATVIHRDSGCVYTKIVLDTPSDQVNAKRFNAPANGAADSTVTANQMSQRGLNTIEQARAVQITAEP